MEVLPSCSNNLFFTFLVITLLGYSTDEDLVSQIFWLDMVLLFFAKFCLCDCMLVELNSPQNIK